MNQHSFWKLAFPKVAAAALLPAALCLSLPTHAGTVTGQVTARIHIGTGCQINDLPDPLPSPLSFGHLDFGDWISLADPGSPDIDASTSDSTTGGITVECNDTISYHITVDGGLHNNAGQRRMQNGSTPTQYVNYGLFTDPARTTPWAINTAETFAVTGTSGSPVTTTHHFYGRVPPQNQTSPGTYTDTVQVVISW